MNQHPPKLYALEALVAQKLSEQGRRRIERHLAGCEICRAALSGVREYALLRDAARDVPMPELSWERMEKALDAPLRSERPGNGKILAIALPMLAVAATVLIGWIGISQQENAASVASHDRAPAAQAPHIAQVEPAVVGWVTAGATDVRPTGSRVAEGDVLRTRMGEELHVRLADGTGIVLWQDSELAVARLRAHQVLLSLAKGSVSSVVKKLGAGDTYAVAAGGLAAEVRGTRFFVGDTPEGVRIDVHEGRVAVMQEGKQIDWLLPGQSHSPKGDRRTDTADRSVLGLDAASMTWPTLTLPVLPEVAAWHVEGARFAATTTIAVREPAGELALSFEDKRGKSHPLKFTLPPEGGTIDEAAIRAAMPELRMGVLAPEQIAPIIEGALPGLQRCYEQGLGLAPKLKGALTLAVRVAADGHVARTQLHGDGEIPTELSQCIAKQAKGWRFEAPSGDGPATFEIELNLKPPSTP